MALVQEDCPLRKCEQGMAMQLGKCYFLISLFVALCLNVMHSFRMLSLLKTRAAPACTTTKNPCSALSYHFFLPLCFELVAIKEGHTLHMVKSATNRANEQAVQTVRPNATSNAGGPDGFDEQVCQPTNPPLDDHPVFFFLCTHRFYLGPFFFQEYKLDFWRKRGKEPFRRTTSIFFFLSHDDFGQYVTRQTRQHKQVHTSTQAGRQDAGQPNNPTRVR